MKKKVFVFGVAVILSLVFNFGLIQNVSANQASDSDDNQLELLETLKTYRGEIYQNLNLTKEQKREIQAIDEKLYSDMTPKILEINFYMKKIKTLAKSDFVTQDEVDEVKREFNKTDKEMSVIKKKYEKNFKKILDKNQNVQYKTLKKEKQAQLEKELKEDIKRQRLEKENSQK